VKPKFLNVEKGGREGRTSPGWRTLTHACPGRSSAFAGDVPLAQLVNYCSHNGIAGQDCSLPQILEKVSRAGLFHRFREAWFSPHPAIHGLDLRITPISTLPGAESLFFPPISPNGRFLAALTKDSRKLTLFDLDTGKSEEPISVPLACASQIRLRKQAAQLGFRLIPLQKR
jgi:hypothetical protein